LFRNLLTALFEHERIETTEAKAKELRGLTDKVISLGKEGTLHARRRALTMLPSKAMVSKLFSDVATRFQDRQGGYTRSIKTRRRPGDAAEMVAIELIERSATTPSPKPDSPSPPAEGS
jgi:large subunit ribosomal protein L17